MKKEKELKISVFEVVGRTICVSSDNGQKVYDRLVRALGEKHKVLLSFEQITLLTSAFLNTAIGQLYGVFKAEDIRALLRVDMLQQDDLVLLKHVVDTAKLYFKNPKKFEQAIREESGDDDET